MGKGESGARDLRQREIKTPEVMKSENSHFCEKNVYKFIEERV